ncbi:unnamed protein product [Mesocestoides corti]|uniref:Uncharacterized protein n=1 Tax=Mesocestoides corti TaxID=53468 RepID=A0A0R3U1H3_MESCO|nr:unnamed protein product [Mesocestoides corti]
MENIYMQPQLIDRKCDEGCTTPLPNVAKGAPFEHGSPSDEVLRGHPRVANAFSHCGSRTGGRSKLHFWLTAAAAATTHVPPTATGKDLLAAVLKGAHREPVLPIKFANRRELCL